MLYHSDFRLKFVLRTKSGTLQPGTVGVDRIGRALEEFGNLSTLGDADSDGREYAQFLGQPSSVFKREAAVFGKEFIDPFNEVRIKPEESLVKYAIVVLILIVQGGRGTQCLHHGVKSIGPSESAQLIAGLPYAVDVVESQFHIAEHISVLDFVRVNELTVCVFKAALKTEPSPEKYEDNYQQQRDEADTDSKPYKARPLDPAAE